MPAEGVAILGGQSGAGKTFTGIDLRVSLGSLLADRYQVTGEVTTRSLNLAKSRWAEEGPIAAFAFRFVQLGTDEDGDADGACGVDPKLDEPPPSTRKAPQKDPLPIVALKGASDEVL